MNIDIPRYFIYKDKNNIDDYEVQSLTPQYERVLESIGEKSHDGQKTMNQRMFEAIENSAIVKLEGADVYALQIFNTAYYITTLLLLNHHPKLYFKTYLRMADEVGGTPGRKNTFHDLFQAMTMAMVCNFLRALNPRYLNVDDFVKLVNEEFTSRYPTQEALLYSLKGTSDPTFVQAIQAQQLFYTNVLSKEEAQKYAVNPQNFLPRSIDDVLKDSNYEDICANIDYIKERIMELPEERQQEAVHIVFVTTQQTGEEEASQYVWETMQEIFASFGYGHTPPELMAAPETDEEEEAVEQLRTEKLQSDNEKEQLKQQNDELRGKVQTAEGNDLEETTWHDKVRLELLLKLFKKVGLNLEKRGNKTKAAEIFYVITLLPLSTCKNYCSNQNLNTKEHEEEILKLNSKLQALDVPILL